MTKRPTAGQLAGALLVCRQDMERQGQQVHNLMRRIQWLVAENEAMRRELGRDVPSTPAPEVDILGALSRRQQASYDLQMGRALDATQCAALIADIDALIAVVQSTLGA